MTWVFLDEHQGTLNDGFFRVIMEDTGFKARLESIGAWGGHRPDDEK